MNAVEKLIPLVTLQGLERNWGTLLQPVVDRLAELRKAGFAVEHSILSSYPAMTIPQDHPLVALAAVSYGAEARLFRQAGIPSVICGPGDIGRAHKANEYITRGELDAGLKFVKRLVRQANA